ncbi:MAG TPA: helix-turn-helix domain-containing protein [Leptolyngbyaceae cyanobacterium M65_K2018_010]|nr:helix-turn-helix domain-containing protein [Leptolyngbyaceae cyanobacterium M65_K2018_010]
MDQASADRPDYDQRLQRLMQRAGLSSYRSLRRTAGISRRAIERLRLGQISYLRVETLLQLSRALQQPPTDLILQFGDGADLAPLPPSEGIEPDLRREYDRLQQQLATQAQEVRQQVQREAITQLESWLWQWPTAVYAAQQNQSIPAARLIPLTKPLEDLLSRWDLVPIGAVGAEVAYDPQLHQPLEGMPEPGQLVRVRYVGYRHGERLLYRAKVSPILA